MPTKKETVYVYPPKNLYEPTPIPRFNGTLYGDLIDTYIPDLRGAVESCNIDKNSIREYVEKKKSEEQK